jgi:glycine dehydrogenase
MVADLTALPVANASLLDEATAAAEAMTLARRVAAKDAGAVFYADADCLPQTLDVLRTRARPLGIDLRIISLTAETDFGSAFDGAFGVLLQYPGASGEVRDLAPVIEAAHAANATVAVAADLLALTLLKPPGELGADVAVGSAQRFGVPMFYGGPHAAYMAVRDDLRRQLPGRLVGVSMDADGRPAYRLALQAREQHIRREKATSNICTTQVVAVSRQERPARIVPEAGRVVAQYLWRVALRIDADRDETHRRMSVDLLRQLAHLRGHHRATRAAVREDEVVDDDAPLQIGEVQRLAGLGGEGRRRNGKQVRQVGLMGAGGESQERRDGQAFHRRGC